MSTEHARDAQTERENGPAAKAAQQQDAQGAAATAVAARAPGSLARFSRSTVSRLQAAAGSRAVSHALAGEGLAVQRHAEGAELPQKDEDQAEVAEKAAAPAPAPSPAPAAPTGGAAPGAGGAGTETEMPANPATPAPTEETPKEDTTNAALPAATRTAEDETKEKAAGAKAGADYAEAQKLTPGAQSLAGAQAVLQGVFGGVHTIVPGSIQILADQPACSRKYDEVCIADHLTNPDTGVAWVAGDRARMDARLGVTVEGFAWKGIVYVNGKTPLITATVHEMLHLNTSADFRATVGETINEGTTEFFARKALSASGVTVPATTAYPTQVKLTTDLISLVGEDVMQNAYFTDVKGLVTAYEAKGSKTFAELKTAGEALDASAFAEALKPKPASATPPTPSASPATPPAPSTPPTPPTGS